MNSYKGLARAMVYELETSMQKIFVLWIKNEFRLVTGHELRNAMMKLKPAKITRIK